jgi:hypothetical protein
VNRSDAMGTRWRIRNGKWVWVNENDDGPIPNPSTPPYDDETLQSLIINPKSLIGAGVATGMMVEKALDMGFIGNSAKYGAGTYATAIVAIIPQVAGMGNHAYQGITNEHEYEKIKPVIAFKMDASLYAESQERPYEYVRVGLGGDAYYEDFDTKVRLSSDEISRRQLLTTAQQDKNKRVHRDMRNSRVDYSKLSDKELQNLDRIGDSEAKNELALRGAEQVSFRVAKHGEMPSPRPNDQSHHGVMSAWMGAHFKNYDPDKAPAILMPTENHRATFGIYLTWRASMRKQMGGTFDWKNVSEDQIRILSSIMMQAAEVPTEIQGEYWAQFEQMIGNFKQK